MLYKQGFFYSLALILLLFAVREISAQSPVINFKHIRSENGLSNSTIETIFQDKRGFMWFGTRDGLNRFDGYQISVYKHDPEDSNSICDNYITSIAEDDQNNLWIGTLNGLNIFNPVTNTFTRFKHLPDDPTTIGSNYINHIFFDSKRRVLVATEGGGVNVYERVSQSFKLIPVISKSGLQEKQVNTLFEDSKGNLWVGAFTGLYLFNSLSGNFQPVQSNPRFREDQSNNGLSRAIRVISEDKSGNLLLGTSDNGLVVYSVEYRTQKIFTHNPALSNSISSDLIRSILVTKSGQNWIGSVNGGLDLFDPATQQFFNYQYQPDNPGSLSQRTVSALFEDKQGNIWIGTHRGGINLYMPGTEKFKLYRQKPESNSLSYNDVKAFCEDRSGNIWIGTDGGGLNLFNREKNNFKHYKYNPFNITSIGSNEVIDILEDSDGNLWVGTWGGGLCLYNPKTDNFIRYSGKTRKLADSIIRTEPEYIQSIFEDSKKNLWVATYFTGLHQLNRKTGKFTRITQSATNKTSLKGNNILALAEDKEGNIWIGTDDGGLNKLDASTGEFSHYFNNEEKKPDLRVLFVDSKGNLWLGQSGLYLFDKGSNSFSIFTNKADLSSIFIKGIVEDNNGILWISTSSGITKLNPETKDTRRYNTIDGLQGQEFEANAFLKTKDGYVFFGGVNGFNSFYPNEITTNNFIPPVFVTDLTVENNRIIGGHGNKILEKDISFTDKITLSHKEATFSFAFAALNFTAAENNQFAYKLENWDKDWIDAGSEKRVTYTNVSPGTYTFYVKASNNDGLWNEKGHSIEVTITPPFWQTWWFRVLVGLTLITAGFYFYRFRRKIHLQKFEERKKEELHQLQLQFFTNISHEFRTPLSLITGPVEKLLKDNPSSKNSHAYQVIQRNANRLLQLINELMDFRKAESGVLKLQVMPGNVPVFINEIAEEFSELAIQKNISFTVTTGLLTEETWFDRQVLEKIIINLLSNSFKYTPDNGSVQLQVLESIDNFKPSFENQLIIENNKQAKKFLYFCITDNGIGISKESIDHLFERYYRVSDSHLGSGIGLAFVKTLTQLHKGNISVFSQRNKGTEFIIAIPSRKADYSEKERWMKTIEPVARLESLSPHASSQAQLISLDKQSNGNNHHSKDNVILIVDDNEELREFLKESLEEQYSIIEAPDGNIAMEKTLEYYPDIIISDIMMPVMDGIEYCRQVKASPETSHIPFILLTGKDSFEARMEGTEKGADYYFSKPLSTELLLLTIRNVLSQKQKIKERYQKDHHIEVKDLAHSAKDKAFIEELINIIENNLSKPELDIEFVCTQIGMSRTKLYNKIKNITGQSIGDFIRTIRLRKAAALMSDSELSLTDIMYSVGIQTQSYFSKAFKNEFGKTPTQFLKDLEAKK